MKIEDWWWFLGLVGGGGFLTWSLGGVGFGDNVYTVRDSEVVSPGCYDASLVSYSAHWTVGVISAFAACI